VVGQVTLEGHLDLVFQPDRIARTTRDTALLYQTPEQSPFHAFEAGQRFRSAGYAMPLERVERLLGDNLPDALRPLLDPRRGDGPRVLPTRNRRAMQAVARGLFTCGLEGPLRHLMMEGAVLQLLALQAAATGAAAPRRGPGLSVRERAAIDETRERLLADMRDPPTLAALAAAVGLTEKRLNAGFREIYGGTIFEVLRNFRLDQARQALEEEQPSLKVIAHRVGYSHVSNFIHAYRARFGAAPRASMKRAPTGAARRGA
jgi:AraC-like DNA-binding protein